MSGPKAITARCDEGAPRSLFYSPELQPLLQSLLTDLVDLDFAYDQERDRLSRIVTDANLKIRVLERLKARHRKAREPHLHQIAALQDQILRRQYS